jgi:hypothetical protein
MDSFLSENPNLVENIRRDYPGPSIDPPKLVRENSNAKRLYRGAELLLVRCCHCSYLAKKIGSDFKSSHLQDTVNF